MLTWLTIYSHRFQCVIFGEVLRLRECAPASNHVGQFSSDNGQPVLKLGHADFVLGKIAAMVCDPCICVVVGGILAVRAIWGCLQDVIGRPR